MLARSPLVWNALNFGARSLPGEMLFNVTGKCNASCKRCFYKREINAGKPELSISEIKRVSESMGGLNTLMISGGEPFMRDDLPEICSVFAMKNKPKSIHIATNASLTRRVSEMTERISRLCPTSKINILVSLDGLGREHDKGRGAKGMFSDATKTLSELVTMSKRIENLYVRVNTVVSKHSVDDVSRILGFVRENFDVFFHGLAPHRSVSGMPDCHSPSSGQWSSLSGAILKYQRYYMKKNMRPFVVNYKYRIRMHSAIKKALSGKAWGFPCLAGSSVGFMDPYGNSGPCQTRLSGNLRDFGYDFRALWNSGKTRRMALLSRRCSSCLSPCFLLSSIAYGRGAIGSLLASCGISRATEQNPLRN